MTPVKRQMLVSAPRVLNQFEGATGWPDVATGEDYALAVRRDRVLLIDHAEVPKDGWHEDVGQTVSDATEAYSIYDISGANAFELLKKGGEVSLTVPSRSVARLMFGVGVFLYPHHNAGIYRLHVARAQGQAMLQKLLSYAQHIE